MCQALVMENLQCSLLVDLMDYIYKITVTRVVDGDTVDAVIHLGFDLTLKKRIRLHGINCPETRTRDKAEKIKGYAAKEFLQGIVDSHDGQLYLQSMDKGKYGRCVGILYEVDFDESVNDMMIYEGHAEPYIK